MANLIPITCPICSSSLVRERIILEPHYKIIACGKCQNAWTWPTPRTNYQVEDFHAQFSDLTISTLPSQWRHSILLQLSLLKSHLTPGARILEIGCGRGLLLKGLVDSGYRAEGIEPSREAVKIARRKGLKVKSGYFRPSLFKNYFDAVLLSHVLEHVPDPQVILNQLSSIAPGGLVLITQSNWQGLMPRVYKDRWYAWVPTQHYWHFSVPGMDFLIRRAGGHKLLVKYSSLEHGGNPVSKVGAWLPKMGDQFHFLAKLPQGRTNYRRGVIEKEYIRQFLPDNPVIIEAGAHVGVDTVEMAAAWPSSTIYCFEPIPKLFKVLSANIAHFNNIKAYPYALGDQSSEKWIYVSEGGSDGSSSLLEPKEHLIDHPKVRFRHRLKVRVTTIDSFCLREKIKPDFLWLDLQGAELLALERAGQALKSVRSIYTEVSLIELYENCVIYSDLKKWLHKSGFKVQREEIAWTSGGNVLFIKKS